MTSRAPSIVVIDYGIGNLHSVQKAIERAGANVVLSRNPSEIAAADGVVLPGVGAMGRCMESLDLHDARGPALDAIASGRPFLGICVGMQMLHQGSEEFGGVAGLGVFDGTVRLLPEGVKRPQMQWNIVESVRPNTLLDGVADPIWVYFVHSFAPEMHNDVVGICNYGGDVAVVVQRDNVMATQFHPEKSGSTGIAILANFLQACRSSVAA